VGCGDRIFDETFVLLVLRVHEHACKWLCLTSSSRFWWGVHGARPMGDLWVQGMCATLLGRPQRMEDIIRCLTAVCLLSALAAQLGEGRVLRMACVGKPHWKWR